MNRLQLLLTFWMCCSVNASAFAQAQPIGPAERLIRQQIMRALRNQGAVPGGPITIQLESESAGDNEHPFADEGMADPDADPADAEQQAAVASRLEQLSELPLNRLPSHIFEAWAKPTRPPVADPSRDELPPAPPRAALYSDVRFELATQRLLDDFALGNWDAIAKFLELLPEKNAGAVYDLMLTAASGVNAAELQGGEDADHRTLQQPFSSMWGTIKVLQGHVVIEG